MNTIITLRVIDYYEDYHSGNRHYNKACYIDENNRIHEFIDDAREMDVPHLITKKRKQKLSENNQNGKFVEGWFYTHELKRNGNNVIKHTHQWDKHTIKMCLFKGENNATYIPSLDIMQQIINGAWKEGDKFLITKSNVSDNDMIDVKSIVACKQLSSAIDTIDDKLMDVLTSCRAGELTMIARMCNYLLQLKTK